MKLPESEQVQGKAEIAMECSMVQGHFEAAMRHDDFLRFRRLIRRHTGIWLRDGKQVMLSSRLAREVGSHGFDGYGQYLTFLESLSAEDSSMRQFINCVTTNKTSFFRESHHFEYLRDCLVPRWTQASASRPDGTVRIWSAACSTGEEPYSIAMTLMEALGAAPGRWQVEVLASDIDTEVLATAAKGVYPEAALLEVSEPLHRRYFLRGAGEMAGSVRVKRELARQVQFARINLVDAAWPVQGPFDAIFFRNALIYFQQDVQNQVLRRMLECLTPDGHLFLGHSEHVPWLYDAVTPLQRTIFQRRKPEDVAATTRRLPRLPARSGQPPRTDRAGNLL